MTTLLNKSLRVIAVAALLPAVMAAQGFGIKAGYSYSAVPNNNGALPGTLSAHDGLTAGIGMNTGGMLGFGIEGLYSQRGFTSSVSASSQKLQYIDVPAYVKVKLPVPMLSPFVYAGPQASYELKCSADGADCPSGREKMTYSAVVGAGVKLLGISVEGRYMYGLTDLHLDTVSNTGNYKSRSFMILAGIGF